MHTGVIISIIIAVSDNDVIGLGGDIPWVLSNDLRNFRRLTLGHKIIIGRKTHESILQRLGRPLDNRQTIVVTRQKGYSVPNHCQVVHSLEEALKAARDETEIFIIGGAEIYTQAMSYAHRMYITTVHIQSQGDTFWHKDDTITWKQVFSETHKRDAHNEHNYTFQILERKELTKKTPKETYVDLKSARVAEQLKIMEVIDNEGFCPFCPEHYSKSELEPVVKQGKYWHIRKNRWPYKNTRTHFIIIHNKHVEKLFEVSPQATQELFKLIQWLEQEYRITSGAIGIRFGDITKNGATVRHLHAHFVSAKMTDRENPNYKPVRFRMG